ncbi:mutator protein [Hordeum vulgare]|nr:mutator protein [Hordeum vulgare]
MFAENMNNRFGRIEMRVVQKIKVLPKGKGATVEKSKSANFELPPTPYRLKPPKTIVNASQTTAASVDKDVFPNEVVPRNDDEDETLFLEHVDHPSKLSLVLFVDTDCEEEEENDNMLIEEEYEGREMREIEWDIDNPNLNAGAVYKNMVGLRNALTMYCIQSNNVYGTEKNEKRKLTVHCPNPRCSWKLHATGRLCNNVVHVGFGDNDAYQTAAAVAIARTLKAAKATTVAVSARLLVRRLTRKKENGSKGREFVTCESTPHAGKDLPPCNHFEWMNEYIERLQMDGLIDSMRATKMVLDLRMVWFLNDVYDAEHRAYFMSEKKMELTPLKIRSHGASSVMHYDERYTPYIEMTGLLPFVQLVSRSTPNLNAAAVTALIDRWRPKVQCAC